MQRDGEQRFFGKRLWIAAFFGLAIGLLWYSRTLFVLVIGSVMIAVPLRALAVPLSRHTGVMPRLSLRPYIREALGTHTLLPGEPVDEN